MTSNEIRNQFIDFFKGKDHTFVSSSSVVPLDDPTLLFTNAGMNQFKDVFLARGERAYKRATNSQKCIRVSGKHNDLEEVGHDTYHHTFFEMLGNWSFGDYYKKEAISWAWELLTDVWKLPKERLYATVFGGDDADGLDADFEAEKMWKEMTNIDPSHILRCGKKDNFWEMGASGPCGPCSEIHIDLTADLSGGRLVNAGVPEVIEIWNLVFIQYNRAEDGKLSPLPARHVDTGAGFERLVAILQNKNSNYDTDVFSPLIKAIGDLCGTAYTQTTEQIAFRVIADHVRMLTFSIADGGMPSNEGRGYVMRRILRRAARYGRKLNLNEPFIYKLVPTLVDQMCNAYPELKDRAEHISKIIRSEEEQFNRTLDRGLDIYNKTIAQLKKDGLKTIPGKAVFKLYDTYGFPVDLTRVIASEDGFNLDTAGFDKAMDDQRTRARASAKFVAQDVSQDKWIVLNDADDSNFVGYEHSRCETQIGRYLITDKSIQIRLLETPFYAESGGQVGDKGTISGPNFKLEVTDTQNLNGAIVHFCKKIPNFMPGPEKVTAQIAESERRHTVKNHTATHLLQAALQHVLGDHVHQAGSLVTPQRLRFDFTHFEKVTPDQINEIEQIVNDEIQKNTPLKIVQKKYDEARAEGAMALFGEKYGDIVRTVRVGDFSLELCGGAHVRSTGEIGACFIVSEEGVASGIRRIEAITGRGALRYAQNLRQDITALSRLLNSPENKIVEKTGSLLKDKKSLEKEIGQARTDLLAGSIDALIANAIEQKGIKQIIHRVDEIGMNDLKELADKIRGKSANTVGLLTGVNNGKLVFVVFVSDDLVSKYKAGDIIREVARAAGGGGGGRPHLATAGGKDVNKLPQAVNRFKELMAL